MEEKKKNKKKVFLIIVAIILAIIIALVSTYFILVFVGKSKFHKNDSNMVAEGIDDLVIDEDTVTYQGKDYIFNKDAVSILFLGIDKDLDKNLGYGKNGQADSLFVLNLNTKTGKIKILPIPREFMVDVNTFSQSGKYLGTRNEQICLAYSYGKDVKESCNNTITSVSRALMGMNISTFIALDLRGVSAITTKMGGVRLNAIEEIPLKLDNSGNTCKVGQELLLKGDSAWKYVQYRQLTPEGSSLRLLRQKQFISAFATTAGNQILGDFTKLKTYYDAITPYTYTNIAFSQITYLANNFLTGNIGGQFEYITIEGEKKVGEEWVEFYPNSESLVSAVLNVFYTEK